ncbi:polysaccharide biosynthesis/export family protein [Tropicibacter sp. R15_0]|uniref:polysaccharide biosynthesis/export family protein n=1 Tax=Tropicibacter sp. R15_0 TaxID=2821101 RepID=UPI001ADA154A|nr:polysaccharide biosynthesis/export family protein [Tropicibacter sp. R15_0]MBO9466438.1 polysaccharide biosynthesis/export family protein [Tropicibacter sp. R15_0]
MSISFQVPLASTLTATLALTLLQGCASLKRPDNIEPVAEGRAYQAQYRQPDRKKSRYLESQSMNETPCLPLIGGTVEDSFGKWSGPALSPLLGEKLTRNDLVELVVVGDDTFSGDYVVSREGDLTLPHLPPVKAQGRSVPQIEKSLSKALIASGFYTEPPQLTLRILDFAEVSVGVTGAVFEPHAVRIGAVSGDRADRMRQGAMGASTEARNLSVALRAAGGVRPDADLSAVELHRSGQVYRMDLRGVFEGTDPTDIMLLSGDQIVVKSRQCFQDDLMRPSPISPPGVTLYMSNLTQPASGNAESAIGRSVREVPYGARFLQAVVDTNCVGGIKLTNANRHAILFSRNPVTQVSVVIERNIERLLRRADRDDYDPYVLPGDAIACYDSTLTNIADLGRVTTVVGTAGILLK